MSEAIPNDENGQVFRRMRANGDALTKSREINFHFLFQTRSQSIGFLELLSEKMLRCEISWYVDRESWQCTVTKNMVPTHAAITEFEDRLIALSQPLEGTADGWGCFEIKEN